MWALDDPCRMFSRRLFEQFVEKSDFSSRSLDIERIFAFLFDLTMAD